MVYYLERSSGNKQNIEALDFNVQQLNFMMSMMRQCRALRQGDVIINLMRCSLPEKFEMELLVKENEDKTKTWKEPLILEKKN